MNRYKSCTAIVLALFTFTLMAWIHPIYALEPPLENLRKPEITRKVLDNGLTILIKEIHTIPIVSIEARCKVGSAYEEKFLGSGISHFVEHMLFKGTSTRGHGEIEKEIKSYSGTINGFTSFDSTGYRLTVKSKYFKEALALLVDAIMNPQFSEEELEKERSVILKEIKLQMDDPDKKATQLLWSTIYTTHPYKYPVIGYEELFKRLRRQDLIAYHKQHYTPNNLVLGICGHVDKNIALEEVEKLFKNYKRQVCEVSVLPKEPQQIIKRERKERSNVKLTHLLIGYHSIPIWHQDLFPLDVLARILGEGKSSILHKRLVETDKIAHAVTVYNYTPRENGIFFISILLDEENTSHVIKAIREEINMIKEGEIDEDQLIKTKNSVLADFILSHETIQAQARDMVEGEMLVGNPYFSSYYVKGIEGVDLEGVVKVANLYLRENTYTTVYLLPKLAEEKKAPQNTLIKDEVKINKFILKNGMRVLIKEDHSLPVVTIRVVFKGGVRVEGIDTNGISNITAEMLLGGTKNRTKDDIYSEIERLGGTITSFSGNNSFGVGMTMLSDNLDFGLGLLSDILLNPAFPAGELEKLKTLIFAAIQNREEDIFASGIKLFKQNLFKDHPYRFIPLGEKESVENMKRGNVLKFYNEFCVPPNMVMSIFGDMDTQKTLARLNRLFRNFRGRMSKRLLGETPKIKTIVPSDKKTMDKEQVLIIGGFKTIKTNDPDVYAFLVLASILSGSDGRLFYDVRDKLGISYTQGVLSTPGLDRGYFLFYIATSIGHLESGKSIIIDEIKRLQEDSVTEEELVLAKADLVGSQLRRIQSNRALAFEVSLDELYGLGYDNFKKFDSKISSVTKEDIDRIVKKYFNLQELTIVTLGPLQNTE